MSQRVLRVIPVTPATEIRGGVLSVVPCPTHWPDGVHAFHHCQYMVTRYAPVAPLTDGYVEDLHDGPHLCACRATLDG
jgi:hypothetical protein